MRRLARAALAALAVPVLATPIAPPPLPGPGEQTTARLFARAVPLNEERPGDRQLGPFRYLGGWVLTSDDRRFGAISSMSVRNGEVIALGDSGILFRFPEPASDEDRVEIIPVRGGPGEAGSKVDRDSEALAAGSDAIWIAYENSNEIWRYRMPGMSAAAKAAPAAMREWPANRGAETLVRLNDGRFLAISEDTHDNVRISDAVLFDGDPAEEGTSAKLLRLAPPIGHRITDGVQIGPNRLLLLSRGFTVGKGWSAKLLVATLPARGDEVRLWEAATLVAPIAVDNMEAIAVTREGNRDILWIASDDNLFALQRTLLMKFEVTE